MRGRKVEGAGKPKVIEVGGDGPLLVIHGGAGKRLHEMSAEQAREIDEALTRSLEAGYALLRDGASAQDAVVATIRVMEDAECFNCGRGAAPARRATSFIETVRPGCTRSSARPLPPI